MRLQKKKEDLCVSSFLVLSLKAYNRTTELFDKRDLFPYTSIAYCVWIPYEIFCVSISTKILHIATKTIFILINIVGHNTVLLTRMETRGNECTHMISLMKQYLKRFNRIVSRCT